MSQKTIMTMQNKHPSFNVAQFSSTSAVVPCHTSWFLQKSNHHKLKIWPSLIKLWVVVQLLNHWLPHIGQWLYRTNAQLHPFLWFLWTQALHMWFQYMRLLIQAKTNNNAEHQVRRALPPVQKESLMYSIQTVKAFLFSFCAVTHQAIV